MQFLFLILQSDPAQVTSMNLFSMMMKGGVIMYPIFLMSILAVYIFVDSYIKISKAGKIDRNLTKYVCKAIAEGDIDAAKRSVSNADSVSARVIAATLNVVEFDDPVITDAMQTESGNQVFRMEKDLSYLSVIASIAPMMGFLGTIFGVIKIFFSISVTNDLSIATISEGLYQKMICSGAGLLVGILAYTGYHILNKRIDRIVNVMDDSSNAVLMAVRYMKKNGK